MKNKRSVVLSLIGTLALFNAAYAGNDGDSDSDSDSDSDRNSLEFRVGLSGAQEVPEVMTDTTGTFRIKFNSLLSKAEFLLKVDDGIAVTQAHIHCGRVGENGPVLAFLFGFVTGGVNVDGKLARGTLTSQNFTGNDCSVPIGMPISNIAQLAFAARAGLLYVNVHTVSNPAGEVRGQIFD